MKFLSMPVISATAAVVLFVLCSQVAAKNADLADKAAADTAVVSTTEKQPYGIYLVDAAGYSLYLFKADTQGKKSACYGKCAEAWPPLLTAGQPYASGVAKQSLVGVIKRKNGALQVTYHGWPLYYYVKDDEPGDTTGHDVMGFGAEWYLVTSKSAHPKNHNEH